MSSAPRLRLDNVSMTFKTPAGVFQALAPVTLVDPAGPLRQPDRPVRLRQEHDLQYHRRPIGADRRAGADRRRRRPPGRSGAWATCCRRTCCCRGARVLDNVILGMEIQGVPLREARGRALPLLQRYGLVGFRASLSERALGRDAPARGAAAHAPVRHRRDPAGRAVRRARRPDQVADAGMADAALERLRQDRGLRDA